MVKTPRPPEVLDFDLGRDVVRYQGPLWRIFAARGPHAQTWDQPRYVGPLRGMRFDPQPVPVGEHPRGVMYAAASVTTAFAEVFQAGRVITRDGTRAVASWIPTRSLAFVDFSGTFLIRNSASFSLAVGPKRFTRSWAHAVDQQLGDQVDGIHYLSAVTGQPAFALFERAWADPSFPATVGFQRTLDDPLLRGLLAAVATELNYGIR